VGSLNSRKNWLSASINWGLGRVKAGGAAMALLFDAKGLYDAKALYDAKGIMHLAASPPNQPASSLLALSLNICRSIACLADLPARFACPVCLEEGNAASRCSGGSLPTWPLGMGLGGP
jgi:hypothetical protein